MFIIRPAAPRQVVVVPAPLVRTISVLPLTPVLPTGQYDSTPIVIDDDDGEEADDEDEADDAPSAHSLHGSTEALHGSETDADPDADTDMSQ